MNRFLRCQTAILESTLPMSKRPNRCFVPSTPICSCRRMNTAFMSKTPSRMNTWVWRAACVHRMRSCAVASVAPSNRIANIVGNVSENASVRTNRFRNVETGNVLMPIVPKTTSSARRKHRTASMSIASIPVLNTRAVPRAGSVQAKSARTTNFASHKNRQARHPMRVPPANQGIGNARTSVFPVQTHAWRPDHDGTLLFSF